MRELGFLTLLILLAAGCTTLPTPPTPPTPPIKHEHWAYIPYWVAKDWDRGGIEKIKHIALFDIAIQGNGQLENRLEWPEKWEDLRKYSVSTGKKIYLTLTLFDSSEFGKLFNSPERVNALRSNIIQLSNNNRIDGLHFDLEIYETVDRNAIESYRKFLNDIRTALHEMRPAQYVSAFIPSGTASQLYDEKTLRDLDFLILQGYDAHWIDGPTAGPLAPLDGNYDLTWKKLDARVKKESLNPQKIFFSFPLYGLEWPVTGNTSPNNTTTGKGNITTFSPQPAEKNLDNVISNVQERVFHHGMQYDPTSASAYYSFQTTAGEIRQGWFEDSRSLEKKLQFIEEGKYRGLAFWALGYDRGDLIKRLKNKVFE